MAPPAPLPVAYDMLTAAFDALAGAPPGGVDPTALRTVWRLLSVLGFAPSLTTCVRDGAPVEPPPDGAQPVAFSVAEGGVLCARCAPPPVAAVQGCTRLPPQAYRDLVALNDPAAALPPLDAAHAAAHRRLVARFVRHHLDEAGVLSALDFWERGAASSPAPSTRAPQAPVPSTAS
jgi:recombinational DNA repair protein (RecF pathway)